MKIRTQTVIALTKTLKNRPEWLIVVVGIVHRAILFLRIRNTLAHVVAGDPGFHVVQLFSKEIYDKEFLTGLWLLQQTPPIPHIIYKFVTAITHGPVGTAELLCAMQGIISVVTAAVLCAFVRDLTNNVLLSAIAALWFLLSTDLLVCEYAFFGQMFYENLSMLIVLVSAIQACKNFEVGAICHSDARSSSRRERCVRSAHAIFHELHAVCDRHGRICQLVASQQRNLLRNSDYDNWYMVYQELRIIRRISARDDKLERNELGKKRLLGSSGISTATRHRYKP